jgi:gamma-glutamyltranspeptidase/glutathione hydrolase
MLTSTLRRTRSFTLGTVVAAAFSVSVAFVETTPAYAKTPTQPAVLTASAVAVADKYAADTAEQIFKEGGNAVDAAVAIAFSLAVTYPEAGNLGGGGFMTLYVDHRPYFLDYRERAPIAATKNMYLDDKGEIIKGMSLYGARAAAVPGTVSGMWEAQKRFGKLKWKQVLAPAIKYAQDGFEVSDQLQERKDAASKDFAGKTNFDSYFGKLNKGTTFKQPELAATLQRISDKGAKGFYHETGPEGVQSCLARSGRRELERLSHHHGAASEFGRHRAGPVAQDEGRPEGQVRERPRQLRAVHPPGCGN